MFVMTSDIRVWNFVGIKPNSVKWKCSVSDYTDTCSIALPLRTYARNKSQNKTAFKEGDAVSVSLGYNGRNTLRFKGFVKRINFARPLVLECEGYSYQLKDIVFTKTYASTTIRKILEDLTKGTDIKLSEYIPDVKLSNLTFKNVPGKKMLDWFQKECLCTVCFYFDELYVGPSMYAVPKPTEKLRIGWNVVEDKELKKDVSDTEIQINLVEKSSTGTVKRTKSEQRKYSTTKEVKIRAGMPADFLKTLVNELQKSENFSGFRGNITTFLEPHFDKGYVAKIISKEFPDKNGQYFVELVEGSFGQSGGRVKLTLKYYGDVNSSGS